MKRLLNWNQIKYSFYVLTHPSDGFYEIRHRQRGSVLLAIIYVMLFSFTFSMNRIHASFIVNDVDPRSVDSLSELNGVLILFFLVCVANWSITCLTEGEGRFVDILTIVGYSMLPMILTWIPATFFSQFVAQDEEAFYYIFITIGVIWSAVLCLVGIMTIHNFTLAKTLFTILLTFVAVLIIIFIFMMISSLLGQLVSFFKSVWTELRFRA